MGKVDLNIIDRGTKGTDWVAENTGIQKTQLDKIKESKTDNSIALNSLPTPFARFFVVEEAFRRVTEEVRNPMNRAGMAYSRIVSDCLDVFELLFNKKYHDNQWKDNDTKLTIKEWDWVENMEEMRNRVPILYNALNDTYKEDIKEKKLYFVVLESQGKDLLLGTSSPMTGFITPPDMDKKDVNENHTGNVKFAGDAYNALNLPRKNGGFYFRDIVLFKKRDKDFKNYMHQLFGDANVDNRFCMIRDYIRMFDDDADIQAKYSIKTAPILTEYNSELVINGLQLAYNDETDINDFFLPTLIKLPYKLNTANFRGMQFERDVNGRDFDFLLPLKSKALRYIEQGLASCVCQLKTYSVTVKLMCNGHEYTKNYDLSTDVYDFRREDQNLNIGLFPNILSAVEEENNYFKIALSVADNNNGEGQYHSLGIDDLTLSFFKKDDEGEYVPIQEADAEHAQFGLKPAVVRSRQGFDANAQLYGTEYYELFNTHFDALALAIKGGHQGFLLPMWKKSECTNNYYTYAIDLGTSNTFVSRTKRDENNAPEMFSMTQPMVSYLHEHEKSSQYSEVISIEDAMGKPLSDAMKTEFVPPFIDGREYKFPIRTVVCKARNITEAPQLFDNHNIAFFYEKMLEDNYQECKTDIKWEENEDCIKVFIRELLLMIKCDILQHQGMLNQTNIIWFRPLSFSGSIKRIYDRAWKCLAKEILFTDNVVCYTESEAPYYYFNKNNIVKNTDTVTVIDIGGGSTDYVYFSENRPISASSVHFGCDVLWGNGHNGFDNVRENGVYSKYIDNLNWGKHERLRKLESEMKASKHCSTIDMVNFWLSNSKFNGIIDRLHNECLPLFAYHFTAIIYYIARLYKYKQYDAPRTIVFSGNGSRYIDNFMTEDVGLIEKVVETIFAEVFGTMCPIHVVMPETRKESTCYGGLYRPKTAEEAMCTIYHGVDKEYHNVGEMNADPTLQDKLLANYDEMNQLYCTILDTLKRGGAIDNFIDLNIFKRNAQTGFDENLSTHYRSDIKEKYTNDEDVCNDSVFFIPVVDKIFELSKLV